MQINPVLSVLVLLLWTDYTSTLSLFEKKKYKDNDSVQGLYSAADDVYILNIENFEHEVYHSKKAWLIEFYNAWCGFCQRFAPSWKALATDIKSWNDEVVVAAIDCSNDKNYPLCREFEIMAYPTLRYFHEGYKKEAKRIGDAVIAGEDVGQHRQALLTKIAAEQVEGRGKMYPNLQPFVLPSEVGKIFATLNLDASIKYIFLIVHEPEASLAQHVAMDLHKVHDIVIRVGYSNDSDLIERLVIDKIPSIVVFKRDDPSPYSITNFVHNREGVKVAIKQYLQPVKIEVPLSTENKDIYAGKWKDAKVPDMDEFIQEREREALKERIKKMGDVIFQMDLETALRYSLKHEVSIVKAISGEKLKALLQFLNVLVKYFPFGKYGQSFLVEMRDKVQTATSETGSLDGSVIGEMVNEAEKEDRLVFSSANHWLACKGSSPTHRGYPCGLWKLFHYLTANAADHYKGLVDSQPHAVLSAMHGYIKHFFGCADCSAHFQEMAAKREIDKVTSLDAQVLWLWQAHNEVNRRLAGDETEDPEYPKYQFPSKERCRQCYRIDDSWHQKEVLKYLKHIYSSINVRYIGSDTRILHMGLEGSSATLEPYSLFKTIDASMCLILYIASFFLIIVLIRMFLKRGYRKKAYVHDLLGKV